MVQPSAGEARAEQENYFNLVYFYLILIVLATAKKRRMFLSSYLPRRQCHLLKIIRFFVVTCSCMFTMHIRYSTKQILYEFCSYVLYNVVFRWIASWKNKFVVFVHVYQKQITKCLFLNIIMAIISLFLLFMVYCEHLFIWMSLWIIIIAFIW